MTHWKQIDSFLYPPAESPSESTGRLNLAQKIGVFVIRLGGLTFTMYSFVNVLSWAVYGGYSGKQSETIQGIEGEIHRALLGLLTASLGGKVGKWIGRDLG